MTSMSSSDTLQRPPGSASDEKHDSTHLVQPSDEKTSKRANQQKKKQPTVPLHRLFRFKTKGDTAMIVVASFCSVIVGFLQPVAIGFFGAFMKTVFDAFKDGENAIDATRPIVLVFVYIGTIILVCAYVGNCFWVLSGQRQINRIRRLYVHAIMRQDMAWFDMAEDGSLTTRLAADAQCIQDGISERFGQMIKTLAAFIIGFVLAFAVCWKLAVIILAVLPFLAAAGGLMGYFVTKATLDVQNSYAEAGSIAEQVFSGIRTVFAFTLQNRFADIYDEKLVEARKRGERRAIYYGIGFGGFLFVLFSIFGIGFWYGGQLIIHHGVSGVWVLVAFFAMLLGAMSLLQMPAHLSAIAAACGAAHKIYATIDRVPDIDIDSPLGDTPEKVLGDIEFRSVQFAYPTRPDLTVLKNFSINIRSGMTVAFVGPSGSGKSTSVQLIQRFYDPIAGSVLLDGKDIKDLNLNWLRRQIGVVSQEPVLFNLTIKQNLLMGTHDSAISHEAVVEACKSANCHDFIMQLPDKYDTIVGEHGGMLSGGQKQRIAIARAILKNPSILLLDEATSALDTQSERLVQKALDSASTNRTTIVIAHRLSTIRNADLIVVMKQGEIVEQGTHNQLLNVDGVYAELVRKQQIGTEDEQELDEEELMKREMAALKQQSDPSRMSRIPMEDVGEKGGEPLARYSTKSSIDVYELKLIKEKAERKSKKNQKAPVRKVLQQMRSEWRLLFIGSIGALVAGAIFPALGYVVARGVSSLAASDATSVAPSPMEGTNLDGFLFLMFGIIALLSHAVQYIAHDTAGERYIERLRSAAFRAFLKQEIGYFDQEENSVGAMTTRLAIDSKNVNDMITKVLGDVMQLIGCLVTGLVIAFYYDWATTLITLLFAPFLLGASLYETRIQRDFEDKVAKANQHSSEIAGEAFKEIRTVAGLGKQSYFESKFERATVRPHKLAKRKAYLASIGYALLQGTIMYAGAVAFYAGMNFIQQGRIETMDMIIVLIEVLITVDGVGRCSIFTSTFVKGKVSAITTFELLERQSAIDPDLEGIEPQTVDGHFSFDDISFRYPARPDMPVFDGDFQLEGQSGQTVALVGPSGCGKSTVIGMLQRWYDPVGGTVRLDENNVKNYSLGNLRSHMALVGQEPVLFDTSIEQNIRFGAPEGMEVTQADVEAAARAANIHAFVSDLPEGYQTRVGDKGSQLSGGQKQRIAIARALIRQPRVLLLDEATSALDSDSEKIVQAAIDTIIKEGNRTTITIAHRLSTIQDADLICVIKAGQVAEKGTHQELLRLNGVYAELVRQQTLTAI